MLEPMGKTVVIQTKHQQKRWGSGVETRVKELVAQPKMEALQRERFLRAECRPPTPIPHSRWTSQMPLLPVFLLMSKKTVVQFLRKGQQTPPQQFLTPLPLLPSNQLPLPSPPHLSLRSARCQTWSLEHQPRRPPHPPNQNERRPPRRPSPKQLLLSPRGLSPFLGHMTAVRAWHYLLLWVLVLKLPPGEAKLRALKWLQLFVCPSLRLQFLEKLPLRRMELPLIPQPPKTLPGPLASALAGQRTRPNPRKTKICFSSV